MIDKFVAALQASGHEIKAIDSAPWVDDLASKLPIRLPASFEEYIKRFSFPVIEIDNIILFSNFGDSSYEDISTAIFRDKAIFETTTKSGFIQFARPSDGLYDPVCFDARTNKKNREYPIVRLDHEDILCNSRIRIKDQIAVSFIGLIEEFIKNPTKRSMGSA